jgi:Glucose / Sorbosone dehydrogenase
VAVLLALVIALFTAVPAEAAVRLQRVGDFDQPVYVTGAPGDYSRLYVVEQTGRIWVVRDGARLPTPFVDLSGAVLSEGEQGLLSVAFAPDYQRSHLLYVYFTDRSGVNRVEQLTAASPDLAAPGRRTVISLPFTLASNHNGGQLQFGRDGYLYLAPGDGGSSSATAQNLSSPLGKVLRIAPNAGGGYSVPPGNPFGSEIWSYGLRNPWRFSFDRLTGDLTIGDVGASTTEEIDYVPAGAGAGRGVNFGWDRCEGRFMTGSRTVPCGIGTLPVIDHSADDGWHTIIGGYVVRDPSLPALNGRYVYGDAARGEVWSARLTGPQAGDDRFALSLPSVVSFGEDAAGCIYAASLAGPVYRLVETSARIPCAPPGDTVAPGLRVRVPLRQRVLRRRGVIGYARCSERCRVRLTARLRIGRASYRLRSAVRRPAADQRVRLRGRLTPRAARPLRFALRHHRRARVLVTLRARDTAGNLSRAVGRRVRVRR